MEAGQLESCLHAHPWFLPMDVSQCAWLVLMHLISMACAPVKSARRQTLRTPLKSGSLSVNSAEAETPKLTAAEDVLVSFVSSPLPSLPCERRKGQQSYVEVSLVFLQLPSLPCENIQMQQSNVGPVSSSPALPYTCPHQQNTPPPPRQLLSSHPSHSPDQPCTPHRQREVHGPHQTTPGHPAPQQLLSPRSSLLASLHSSPTASGTRLHQMPSPLRPQ